MTSDDPDALDPLLRRRFEGTVDAVRAHLLAVEALARASGAGADRYADVLIVLGEVLNNIVEHAFADVDAGWIECTICRRTGHFIIETCDNGTPLPPNLLSAAAPPDVERAIDDMPEGGFGWFIVHTLAKDMMYERANGRNHLSFSLQIT